MLKKDENGKWIPFFAYIKTLGEDTLTGINIFKDEHGKEHVIIRKILEGKEVIHHSRDTYNDKEEFKSLFSNQTPKDLIQQLKSIGFQESNNPNQLTREIVGPNNQKIKLIAIHESGKLLTIIHKAPSILKPSNIIGYRSSVRSPEQMNNHGGELILEDGRFVYGVYDDYQYSNLYPLRVWESKEEFSKEEIGFSKIKKTREKSGFLIGGENDSGVIENLESINNIPIENLESFMRPGAYSDAGFLGSNESLIKILKEDNDFVLSKGKTHQELAYPLKYFESLYRGGLLPYPEVGTAYFNGIPFQVDITQWRGYQGSPFHDGTRTDIDVSILNLKDGSALSYSPLVGDMIARYGFYEGHGTPYRVDPSNILKTFGMKKDYENYLKSDPVSQLVQYPSRAVTISTKDQLQRLFNLIAAKRILPEANFNIEISDFDTLKLYRNIINNTEDFKEIQDRVSFKEFPAREISLDEASSFILNVGRPALSAHDSKKLQEKIMKSIGEIDASASDNKSEDWSWHYDIAKMIKKAASEESGSLVASNFLSKLNFNGTSIERIKKAFIKGTEYKNEEEDFNRYANVVEKHFSQELDSWRNLLDQQKDLLQAAGHDVPQTATFKQLVDIDRQFTKILEEVKEARSQVERLGKISTTEKEVSQFLVLLNKYRNDPLHSPSLQESNILSRFKIDPTLIPFVVNQGSNNRADSVPFRVSSFYNGVAQKSKDTQDALAKLPQNMDAETSETAQRLISSHLSNRKKSFDLEKLIALFAQKKTLTKRDLILGYLSLHKPDLKDLFESPYLKYEVYWSGLNFQVSRVFKLEKVVKVFM